SPRRCRSARRTTRARRSPPGRRCGPAAPGRTARSRCPCQTGSSSRTSRCAAWRYNYPSVLTVNEIFHSIQGESTHEGRPCVFVRLTACDLRCSWCDTPYAFYEGRKMSLDDVMAAVDAYGCSLVELTGGQPLLQKDVYPLMERLLASGKTVLVETGGHLSVANVPPAVHKIVDVKCPGSGEAHRMDWSNLDRLSPTDEVKFVVRDRTD